MAHDIEAKITFLTPEEGGRSSWTTSGYRPDFYYNGNYWCAMHNFPFDKRVDPGQTVASRITFLSPENHGGLMVGTSFELREGQRTVARGIVTKLASLLHPTSKTLEERAGRLAQALDSTCGNE